MSNGAPDPIPSPLPEQSAPPKPHSREDDPLKEEKKRRSHIVRYYGKAAQQMSGDAREEVEDMWVDVEVIDNATMSGGQFGGYGGYSGHGATNLAADTILTLAPTGQQGNRERCPRPIQMDPSDKYKDRVVKVPNTQKVKLKTQRGETLDRSFNSADKNKAGEKPPPYHPDPPKDPTPPPVSKPGEPPRPPQQPPPPPSGGSGSGGDGEGMRKRIQVGFRIASNGIDDEFLVDSGYGEKRKAPPSDPSKYMEAIRKSDEEMSLFLNVYVPYGFWMTRGKTSAWLGANFVTMWGEETTYKMPGSKKSNEKERHVVVDPYQAIVNFGPDSLAAEFFKGEGPAKDKPADPPSPPPTPPMGPR